MDAQTIQILESLAILVLYGVAFLVANTIINNTLKYTHILRARRKFIIKVIHLFISIIALVLLAGVWGLKQREIAIFSSTILTALGIAFFAQWSLLSNITSSLILFFNYPLKLGDTIKVFDKDYPFEGEVTELTYFFVHLKTTSGDLITIPNSLFLQKSISVITEQKKS
jgi:small-conductance mechanosensitive channel